MQLVVRIMTYIWKLLSVFKEWFCCTISGNNTILSHLRLLTLSASQFQELIMNTQSFAGCPVVEVSWIKQQLYRLQVQFGILMCHSSASDLEGYFGEFKFGVTGWEKEPQPSLWEAILKQNLENAFYDNSCCCKTASKSRRCLCKASKKTCPKWCHNRLPCHNEIDAKELEMKRTVDLDSCPAIQRKEKKKNYPLRQLPWHSIHHIHYVCGWTHTHSEWDRLLIKHKDGSMMDLILNLRSQSKQISLTLVDYSPSSSS